jgi:hypothetical protein
MGTLAKELQRQNPGIQVSREKGGIVDLVKKVPTQDVDADVIAMADYRNIKDFLYGRYVY